MILRFAAIVLLVGVYLSPTKLRADQVVATKDCTGATTVTEGSFNFAVPQTVRWSARYDGAVGTCTGNAFWLSKTGSNMVDTSDTRLRMGGPLVVGTSEGTALLDPAPLRYYIAIKTALMGQGRYVITYNQDLFLQRWNGPPEWKSPDISAVGTVQKGRVNTLQITVHKRNSEDAKNVQVGARWAPISAGIPDSAFKSMTPVITSVSGSAQSILVSWDLTNLGDTNGGQWPMPVRDFDHFCVKATAYFSTDISAGSYPQDINIIDGTGNKDNEAQTNFFNVPLATSPIKTCFLVGNPLHERAQAQLELTPVPAGVKAMLHGPGESGSGGTFTLDAGEIRSACLEFAASEDWLKAGREEVVGLNLRVAKTLVGGIGFNLRPQRGRPGGCGAILRSLMGCLFGWPR